MASKASKREICARCGKMIPANEVPSVWRDYIVCTRCHSKLRAVEPAVALTPGAMPVLKYAPKPARSYAAYDPRMLLSRAVSMVSGRGSR